MNREHLEPHIERRWCRREHHRHPGRRWAGLFLLLIGVVLVLQKAGAVLFPNWLISWPVLLILVGLFSMIRHRFRGGFWIFALLMGGFLLARDLRPDLDLQKYTGPALLIGIGIVFLLRPRSRYYLNWEKRSREMTAGTGLGEEAATDRRDFVDVTSIFGGVKKNLLTKNFQGGDINCVMGGAEIDLSQADFTGQKRIDVTCVMGGAKLIVPSSWDVQSDITAIFGGVDDKRQIAGVQMDGDKVLILDGTCLFGGIEIRSF